MILFDFLQYSFQISDKLTPLIEQCLPILPNNNREIRLVRPAVNRRTRNPNIMLPSDCYHLRPIDQNLSLFHVFHLPFPNHKFMQSLRHKFVYVQSTFRFKYFGTHSTISCLCLMKL